MAFPRQNQQAFLEAHVAAFEFFEGCFATCRYDNLGSAVKTVLKGRRRVESDRFVALRSHYLFCSEFTRVGVVGAPKKPDQHDSSGSGDDLMSPGDRTGRFGRASRARGA